MAERKGTTKTTGKNASLEGTKKMTKREEAIARAKAEGFYDDYEEPVKEEVNEEVNEEDLYEEAEYEEEQYEEPKYEDDECEDESYDESDYEEEYEEEYEEQDFEEEIADAKDDKSCDRTSKICRKTAETDIKVSFNIDGTGKYRINTGIGFFDHMLNSFTKHGLFDMELVCNGDLYVDTHHTIEDVGIVIGTAIKEAVGDKKGIRRYASEILPMDDALVLCALDLSGRPYLSLDATFNTEKVGYMDTCMVREFFYAVSYSAGMNLHLKVLDGVNDHHIIEAMFKSFAKALDTATGYDPRIKDVLSTKGSL